MKAFATAAAVTVLLGSVASGRPQDAPRSGIYQIQSGTYTELGGFVGVFQVGLPYPGQAFVSLKIDSSNKAQLFFLSQNQQSTFYIQLTNGAVSANTIRFQYWTTRPLSIDPSLSTHVDYTVTNAAGHLWIGGGMTSAVVCCDIPYLFAHTDVAATFVPTLNLSFTNGVAVCWSSATNQSYQLQYLSDFSHDVWTNLGASALGNGTTNCLLVDGAPPGMSPKSFRIVTLP